MLIWGDSSLELGKGVLTEKLFCQKNLFIFDQKYFKNKLGNHVDVPVSDRSLWRLRFDTLSERFLRAKKDSH